MKTESEAIPRVDIVPYDPRWPALYGAEYQLLTSCLPNLLEPIEHIGSTAVPLLSAKPIIDIMAATANLNDFGHAVSPLTAAGYVLIETGMRNRLFFRRRAEPSGQLYHLHVVERETWAHRKERIMRDYLIDHPTAAVAYGLLKQDLAKQYTKDSLAYTKAKTEFIQTLLDQAYDRLGRPRINAWE